MRARGFAMLLLMLGGGCNVGVLGNFWERTCQLEGAVWEVTDHDPPRTGRWQGCELFLRRNSDFRYGTARLSTVTVEGVDGVAGQAEISFRFDAEPPVRLMVRGAENEMSIHDGQVGAWVTLLDEEDQTHGYVPEGVIRIDQFEFVEGEQDVRPDLGGLTINLTGLTYEHLRRGTTTLNGSVTLRGVEAGCFPRDKLHWDGSSRGDFDPNTNNGCGLPLEAGRPYALVPRRTFREGATCGACVTVLGRSSSEYRTRVIGECEDCGDDDVRLDPETYAQVTADDGDTSPTWRVTTCDDLEGPVAYHFRDDSSAALVSIQPRNNRQAVETLEIEGSDGDYVALQRERGWYVGEGFGPGPFDIRIVDIYGHEIEDLAIELRAGESVPGGYQFPNCDTFGD